MLKLLAISGAFALSACNSEVPTAPVDVATLHRHIHDWNGKTVVVDGWLGKCQGYDCAIFPQPITEQQYQQRFEEDFNSHEYGKSLPIGASNNFDTKVYKLQFSRVLLKATINDRCYPHECKDRADVLQPIEIIKFTKGSK